MAEFFSFEIMAMIIVAPANIPTPIATNINENVSWCSICSIWNHAPKVIF